MANAKDHDVALHRSIIVYIFERLVLGFFFHVFEYLINGTVENGFIAGGGM